MTIEEILLCARDQLLRGETQYICFGLARAEGLPFTDARDTKGFMFLSRYFGLTEDSDQWQEKRKPAHEHGGRAHREWCGDYMTQQSLDRAMRVQMLDCGISLARRLGV